MDPKKPVQAAKKAVETVADAAAEMLEKPIPGAPGSEPPPLEEPTTPTDPLPPKPDQDAPEIRTPTGDETGRAGGRVTSRAPT